MIASRNNNAGESGQFHLLGTDAFLDVAGEQHDANARTHGVSGQAAKKIQAVRDNGWVGRKGTR